MEAAEGDRGSIRTVIADDEALARRRIRKLLADRQRFEVVAETADGRETVTAIREYDPDLIFLDVQMPELSGFEVVDEIGPSSMPVVVFVTAYDEYALQAFEVHALDYLLKPFDDERFEATLARADRQLEHGRIAEVTGRLRDLLSGPISTSVAGHEASDRRGESHVRRFPVKRKGRISFVEAVDVDWIEAEGDYVRLHTRQGNHLIRTTMKALEKRLDPAQFLRIHRSAIVRINQIKELTPHFHGEYVVLLHSGAELRLSRTYKRRAQAILELDL